MSGSCCSVDSTPKTSHDCPVSGSPGKPVKWLAVAALVAGRVPPKQEFWLCRDPDCEVVYFSSCGEPITVRDVSVIPGFKTSADDLVCYCFQHRRGEIAAQLQATGETSIPEAIKQEIQAGNCACEVRNPSGKCCMGEVQATVAELKRQLAVGAPA